jgi:hypothetical protein
MSTLTSLEESTLTSLQELIEDYVTDCARESIIEPLAVSFFGTLDGRIEKNDPQPYKKEQLYVWRERRGFYYYLFTLPGVKSTGPLLEFSRTQQAFGVLLALQERTTEMRPRSLSKNSQDTTITLATWVVIWLKYVLT